MSRKSHYIEQFVAFALSGTAIAFHNSDDDKINAVVSSAIKIATVAATELEAIDVAEEAAAQAAAKAQSDPANACN